jgi:hypothetical protein
VLFAEQQLREAAGWVGAEVSAAPPANEADERHLLSRYNLAYVRLVANIGEQWRPKRRPADLDELREWAEAALHRLVGGDLAGSDDDNECNNDTHFLHVHCLLHHHHSTAVVDQFIGRRPVGIDTFFNRVFRTSFEPCGKKRTISIEQSVAIVVSFFISVAHTGIVFRSLGRVVGVCSFCVEWQM